MCFQEEDENVKSLRTTDDGRKRTAIAHSELKITLFLLGASKNVIQAKCFLLNLYFTWPNGQVVIKTYVAL